MLTRLMKEADEQTPYIVLDKSKNVFHISGISLPENADKAYKPVFDWLKLYIENPNPITEFIFDFDYYNSSTVRIIVDIMLELEKIQTAGNKVNIIWYYDHSDNMMKDNGEDLRLMMNLPFCILPKEK
jgi:hypothetical protein